MQFSSSFVAVAALFLGSAIAHPGHDLTSELAARAEFRDNTLRRDLSHCSAKLKARGVTDRGVQRRSAKAQALRAKRGLTTDAPYRKRDVVDTAHLSDAGYTLATDESVIFADNSSCVLQSEETEGPYYVSGEDIREDVTDGQVGVDLTLEIQVLDIETCEPIEGAYIDFWHCNATGVYSGVIANGNGNTNDESNLQSKALRGLQATDDEGVATFQSIVPGHYTGRTNHIHIYVHLDGTVETNDTLVGGSAVHVGQLFFDQDLVTEVEATEPYASNTQTLTTNAEDSIYLDEAGTTDPIVEYTVLGDDVSDGLLAWISVAVNTTYSRTVSAAASCYEDGCVTNSNSGGGGGGGPGGAPPSLL